MRYTIKYSAEYAEMSIDIDGSVCSVWNWSQPGSEINWAAGNLHFHLPGINGSSLNYLLSVLYAEILY